MTIHRDLSLFTPLLLLAACNGAAPDQPQAPANGAETVRNVEAPAPVPSPTPVEQPTPAAPGPVEQTIGFPTGEVLDDAGRKTIDTLLTEATVPGRFILRGHSDSKGSDQANLAASRRRAEAVRDYMLKKGVAKARLHVIALGEGRPIAPNVHLDGSDDETGRARNRRVEIMFVPVEEPPEPTASPQKLTPVDPR